MMLRAWGALVGKDLELRRWVCASVNDDGVLESLESWGSCPSDAKGGSWALLLPQPANAHVHSADGAFPEFGVQMGLHELVAPFEGLKYRLLSSMGPGATQTSVSRTYFAAYRSGVGLVADFREGGGEGCMIAQAARRSLGLPLDVVVLGTPGPGWLMGCNGLGLSSPLDYPEPVTAGLARDFRPSATHVAEDPVNREAGDLEVALRAGFDVLIHGTYMSERDLDAIASAGVTLVLCPSSNLWHGLRPPPVAAAIKAGVRIALGTDNAAWGYPSPWREAALAVELARSQGMRGPEVSAIMEGLFINGYEAFGVRPRTVEEGRKIGAVIVDAVSSSIASAVDVYYAILKRSELALRARVDGNLLVQP